MKHHTHDDVRSYTQASYSYLTPAETMLHLRADGVMSPAPVEMTIV
jgi:hypothetical protein